MEFQLNPFIMLENYTKRVQTNPDYTHNLTIERSKYEKQNNNGTVGRNTKEKFNSNVFIRSINRYKFNNYIDKNFAIVGIYLKQKT